MLPRPSSRVRSARRSTATPRSHEPIIDETGTPDGDRRRDIDRCGGVREHGAGGVHRDPDGPTGCRWRRGRRIAMAAASPCGTSLGWRQIEPSAVSLPGRGGAAPVGAHGQSDGVAALTGFSRGGPGAKRGH